MSDTTNHVIEPRIPLYVGAELIGHAYGHANLTRTPEFMLTTSSDDDLELAPPVDDEERGESGWDYLRHTPEYVD